jgi:hypothetical protein
MSQDERIAAMYQKEGMLAIAKAINELAKAILYLANANGSRNK